MPLPIVGQNASRPKTSQVLPTDPRSDAMQRMEAMGYRFVGKHKHSAIKICDWCRKSLGERGHCYKQKFYDIDSHECVQMSPAVFVCTENCLFCWRAMRYTVPSKNEKWDKPSDIIDGCIEEQRKILRGFGGNKKTDDLKLHEAMRPKHFAISLSGEPTLYPMIGEFIEELHRRNITSYLVSNGTLPEKIKSLLDNNQQPTQMYMTLAAPSKKIFHETAKPFFPDAWDRLQKSLGMLHEFRSSVIRLTLVRKMNLLDPQGYGAIADRAAPKFLEVKGFVSVGGARERLPFEAMPRHEEIRAFAEQIERHSSYTIRDEKQDSRVILMTR